MRPIHEVNTPMHMCIGFNTSARSYVLAGILRIEGTHGQA